MFTKVLNYLWEVNEDFRNEIYNGWNSNILKPMKERYDASCDKIDKLLVRLAEYEAIHAELNDSITSLKKTISSQKKELKTLNAKIREFGSNTVVVNPLVNIEPDDTTVMNTPIVGPGDGQSEPEVKSKKKKKK